MSGYVEKTLGNGEDIVYRAHFNWTYSFWSIIWMILALIPVVFLGYTQFGNGVAFDKLKIAWVFAGLAFSAGAIQLLAHMIVLWTTEIVVTTFRFVYKTGLISRNSKEVSLNKIEEITMNQSVWGRVFNYGHLTLRGTGVGVIELPAIDEPIRVRRIIENAKSALRGGGVIDEDSNDL